MKLSARDLVRRFQGLIAVDGVSFDLDDGEVLALIGPNGAGKSTVFALLAGRLQPTSGQIFLGSSNITHASLRKRVQVGIVGTFQIPRVFGSCTVGEVLRASAGYGQNSKSSNAEAVAEALCSEMKLPINGEISRLDLHGLRILEIARAIATDPHILLLDEVGTGLDRAQRISVIETIAQIASRGTGVLVIEHSMGFVRSVASRAVVLSFGKTIASGSVEEVLSSQTVIDAYLGGGSNVGA